MPESNNPMRKQEKGIWKKIGITLLCSILLAALYFLIFLFSAQSGEESGSLSAYVSEICAEFFNAVSGRDSDQTLTAELAKLLEHPVRKLAHFAEYAAMGFLVYLLWAQWIRRGWRLSLLTAGWVFLSAAADETHQLFVPGRYGSVGDVLLDTCGGIFGMLCLACMYRVFAKGSYTGDREQTGSC